MTDIIQNKGIEEGRINKIIGQNIKTFRRQNGMSQKHLAEQLGISAQGLLKIEKGIVSTRATTIGRIMENTGITPNQLFGIEEMSERKKFFQNNQWKK